MKKPLNGAAFFSLLLECEQSLAVPCVAYFCPCPDDSALVYANLLAS